jgi:hypothetical protein
MATNLLAELGELAQLSAATREANGAVFLGDPGTPALELALVVAAEIAHGESLPLAFLSPGPPRRLRRRGDLPVPYTNHTPWSLTRCSVAPDGVLVVDLAGIPESHHLRELVAHAAAEARFAYAAGHPWSRHTAADVLPGDIPVHRLCRGDRVPLTNRVPRQTSSAVVRGATIRSSAYQVRRPPVVVRLPDAAARSLVSPSA